MVTKLKPYNPSASELVPSWHVIDAKGKVLGRLATEISMKLMGKDRPGYVPHMLSGDFVVVINASQVKITGQKAQTKVYRRHSQKPGNLKEIPYETVLDKFPERIIEHSVKGMLPKNKLGTQMLKRLKVYAGEEHPHSAQLIGSERRLAAIASGELEQPKKKATTRRRKPKQESEEVAAATAAAPTTEAPVEEAAEEEAPKTAAKKAPAKKAAAKKPATRTRKTAAAKSTGTKKAAASKSTATKSTRSKSAAAKSSTSKSSTTKKASTSRSSSSKSSSGSTSTRRSTSRSTSSRSTSSKKSDE